MAGTKASKNATSFRKGASGNPKGAPLKEESLSFWIRKALNEARTVKEYEEARTNAEAMASDYVAQYWTAQTVQEKSMILDRVADRTEGKPKQSADLTTNGKDIQPVLVRFIGDED